MAGGCPKRREVIVIGKGMGA
jgi:hypothetical protein